jgi:hypothetical protein
MVFHYPQDQKKSDKNFGLLDPPAAARIKLAEVTIAAVVTTVANLVAVRIQIGEAIVLPIKATAVVLTIVGEIMVIEIIMIVKDHMMVMVTVMIIYIYHRKS